MLNSIGVRPFFQQAIETGFKETGLERKLVLDKSQQTNVLTQSYLVNTLLIFIKPPKNMMRQLGNPHIDLDELVEKVPNVFDRMNAYEQIGQTCIFSVGMFPALRHTTRDYFVQNDFEIVASAAFRLAAFTQDVVFGSSNPVFNILAGYIFEVVETLQFASEKYFPNYEANRLTGWL